MMPAFHFTKKRFVTSVLCAFFILMAAGWVFTGYLVEMATRTVKHDVEDANLIISLNLTNELKRIESAAVAVAGSPLTLPVLQANIPANMEKINNILDRYHKSLDAAACYLINSDGLTLASSNRNAKDSFVGQNYTFRPYFQQAIKGGVGQHFAVGTVTGRRGFFASAPVKDKEGQIVGVVVIKKELEDIEIKLKQYIWFLVDQNGIIFISSQPEARLKSLWPQGNEQKQKIILSKQYGPGPFEPVLQKQLKDESEVTFKGGQYLSAQVATPYEGISVVLLWPTGQISMYRSFGIILTLLTILLSLSFLTVIYIFTQSNFRMKSLLKESQSQAAALADSEGQLRARKDELEGQKELLAQAEERSRLILGSIGEGIFGVDKEGRVTFLNPAASTILGYTEEEMLGELLHDRVHYAYPDGSEFPWLQCSMCLTSQDGKVRTVDNEVFWRKDGTAIPVEYSTTPVWKDGQVVAAVVSFHDITERKRAESLEVEKEVAEEAAARAEQAKQEAERAQEELRSKVLEIERFNRLALGREERIIDLKRQINDLDAELGRNASFRSPEQVEEQARDDMPVAEVQTTLGAAEIKQEFIELLQKNELQEIFTHFCNVAGVPAAIIDLDANILASSPWQRACTDFHRVNKTSCARCIESDTNLALNLQEGKDYAIYRCRNGMTDCASPIVIDGYHIANVFIGQFHLTAPDDGFFATQADELGFDRAAYLKAVHEAPVMDEAQLPYILGFLSRFAKLIGSFAIEQWRARRAELNIRNYAMTAQLERTAAMSLAEDANQARLEIERFKEHLELLVQERTNELRTSEERGRLILSSVSEGIFGIDAGGRVTFVNPAVNAILGYTEEEMIGKLMHTEVHYAYPDGSEFPRLQCPMYLSSQDGKSRIVDNEVLWRKGGTAVPVEYSTTPVWKDGQVIGTVVSFRDITERKLMDEKLRHANFLSDQALDLSHAGYWHIPLNTGDEYYNSSKRAATIFGDPPREDWRYHLQNEWFANVEAGDKAAAEVTGANYTAAIEGTVPRYDATYAYKRPIDGRVVWINAMGHVVRDAKGTPTDMYGVTMDITERKQAEKELKERMEELERFSRLTINREEKMIQLKEEINILLEQTGREKKYKIVA